MKKVLLYLKEILIVCIFLIFLYNQFCISQVPNIIDKIIIFTILSLLIIFIVNKYYKKIYNNVDKKNEDKLLAILLSIAFFKNINNSINLYSIVNLLSLFLIFLMSINLLNYFIKKNKKVVKYGLLYLFIILNIKQNDLLTTLIFTFTILLFIYKYNIVCNDKHLQKYDSKINKFFIYFISLVISFMFQGHNLFLSNNLNYLTIISNCSLLILLTCIVRPIILVIIYYFENGIKQDERNFKVNNLYAREKIFSNLTIIFISLIISVCGCLILDDYVINKYKDTTIKIEATGKKGKLGKDNEVYIERIQTSYGDYDISKIKTSDNWDILNNGSIVYHYSNNMSIQDIKIPKSRFIRIYFSLYDKGGIVKIHDGDKSYKYDLSSNDKNYINNYLIYNVKSNLVKQNSFILFLKYMFLGGFIFIVSYLIQKAIYKIRLNNSSIEELYINRRIFTTIFLIIFSIMTINLIAYYPGNYSWDNLYQIQQALTLSPIDNGHPIIMTLLIKFLLKIHNSLFFVSLSLIILIALILSTIFKYIYKRGINKNILTIIIFIFCLLPNTIMMSTNFLKDVPQSYLILLCSYFIFLICKDDKLFSKNLYYLVLLPIVISTIGLLRHESLYICYFVIISISIYCIIKKNFKILISVLSSLIIIFGFEMLINSRYNFENKSELAGAYIFPAKGLAGVLAGGGDLSEESKNYLRSGMKLEDWKKNYSPYNIDSLSFNNLMDKSIERKGLVTPVKCYIHELINNPYLIIKDRLNSMDVLWNIHTNSDYNTFKYHDGILTFYMMGPKEFGLKSTNGKWMNNSNISNLYRKYIDFSSQYDIFNILFWRAGIYISLLFIIILYTFNNDKKQLLTLSIIIGKTLLWCILLGCQHYRYVYYLALIIPFIILLILTDKKEKYNL